MIYIIYFLNNYFSLFINSLILKFVEWNGKIWKNERFILDLFWWFLISFLLSKSLNFLLFPLLHFLLARKKYFKMMRQIYLKKGLLEIFTFSIWLNSENALILLSPKPINQINRWWELLEEKRGSKSSNVWITKNFLCFNSRKFLSFNKANTNR